MNPYPPVSLADAYRRELEARAAYLAAPNSGVARAAYLRAMRDTDAFRN